jgi:hypothetical protein
MKTRGRIAFAATVAAASFSPALSDHGDAFAQSTVQHVEACSHNSWGFLTFSKWHFGTTNMCDQPITIWFMTESGKVVHADVPPRGVFDSGLTRGQFDETDWAAAVCPRGFQPRPSVSKANWNVILNSKYVCVAGTSR